jgi:hypothetical protein
LLHSHTIAISSARAPNFPRSIGPHTSRHAARPIHRSIHARAVTRSKRSPGSRWSATAAAPIRTRATGGSGRKRSRSPGDVNGHSRPWANIATLEPRQSISSPSSS